MSMSEKYLKVLRDCRVDLGKDLNTAGTMDYLIAAKIIVPDDAEVVNAKADHREKSRAVLNLIEKRGDAAFEALREALRDPDCSNLHLSALVEKKLTILQSAEEDVKDSVISNTPLQCTEVPIGGIAAPPPANPPSFTSDVDTLTGIDIPETSYSRPLNPTKQLTEQLLGKLASNLGQEWEKLAARLCISKNDVFKLKAENQFNVWSQVFGMLVKWKQRQHKDATIGNLVQALIDCEIGQETYAFLLTIE